MADAPKHIEHIRSLVAENQMVSRARKEEGFHAALNNVSTVNVLPDSIKKGKVLFRIKGGHVKICLMNVEKQYKRDNTCTVMSFLNLVPRSLIDGAEGEIWSNPILYT